MLTGFHLLQEKEFQDSSIRAHLDDRNNNFETDLSSFIDSALSRTRRRITLDRVFIDHPTQPQLLTDPKDIDDAVVNHFQNFVPIKSTLPVSIDTLPDRWSSAYQPMDDVSSSIYDSLMNPPTLDEWLSTVSSTPNGKASGPSMITYEMLKHLGSPMVFPIPKPHEWKCQLKNTRPITLLEVIRKSLVKLFYNRLSTIMASHDVPKGGNFAGLPGGSCRDPIITLESIIHDADINKNPLWILFQDISKAFDSVDLTMLRFALERIRLPASAVKFILSLFMKRTNRVFTAHGSTPAYRVRIGIDQGEVISPLLWVIYIDPLLTILKNEMMDPYVLSTPSLIDSSSVSLDLKINNLVFMDDSTLISSSKAGMEFMLSITEEFYQINNTSANHNKYVLITNSLPLTPNSTLSPITFNLDLSSLNSVPSITITPISMTTSFRFLGVWFNIKSSHDFVKKQLKRECCSFAATIRPAKLSSKQVVYLYNAVLVPKLEYRMQVTHLSESECHLITRSIRSVVKHKANFSRFLPNPILFLSQALGLINLFAHQRQCHITNLFLMANSSSSFIQSLFIYRLCLIQYNFLIPISPLLIKDWSIWSSLFSFKKDYIACTIALLTSTPFRLLHTQLLKLPNLSLPDGCVPLFECMTPKAFKAYFPILRKRQLFYLSQLVTPQGTHLISWKAYYDNLVGRRGPGRIPYWYKDIQQVTTISDSNNRLLDHFTITPKIVSSSYELAPCSSSPSTTKNWIVTLDDYGSPIFGKQLLVQTSRGTCSIVHWISPDCESSPGDLIRLSPCPGCAAHTPLPPSKKRNADLTLCTPTVSLQHSLILPTTNERIRRTTSEVASPFTWADIEDGVRLYYSRLDFDSDSSSADTVIVSNTPLTIESSAAAVFANSPHSRCLYGLVLDANTEAAAIYAVLTISPRDSEVTIYTDSQTAIDGLRSCSSFVYSNSRLYYKTTNFELWAIIERTILSKNLTVFPVKVKAHSGNYLNDFADSLANTAHTASSSILISGMDLASAHDFVLVYDNDVVCESNPRHLLKLYYQTQLMRDLLNLTRFHFTSLLTSNIDYIIDWEITWFTLNFKPSHDASFTPDHASRHLTFKFKLFLDDLPTLEKLKRTRPDLYMDELTCRSCIDRMEDLMHLFMCKNRRLPMQQILQSYQNHLLSKLLEAGNMADIDLTPLIAKLTSFSCWSFSSTNWSSYALVRGCLPKLFIDLFVDLSIPRNSAIKVIAAIHNNFVQKFRRRIWNPRSYDKSRWENAMNITYKMKTTLMPSNLPLSTYIPYSSLPPLTLHDSRDSRTDWLKNSMKYGWSVDFYSGRAIRYFVSIVASTLFEIYQGGRSGEIYSNKINKDKGYYAMFAWFLTSKNTRPITLLEVIRISLVKLFYNRLSTIMASHNVLKGGNFAGLPGGSCRDPIITLESIIHDADINKNPLWILSQDISKAFDSVDLTMLRFALERIRLPASAVKFILSFFTKRTNRVFTAHGSTPAYRVRIGIDQGEVISPLLWVIYIDPLLTVLKNEMMDPYVLSTPSLIDSPTSSPDLKINNLVFMDDSTLIFSSKAGMAFMLSITEEFYQINNTSANHNKYVLITNSLPLTSNSTLLPITFNLDLSSLNSVPSITITPISMTTSFRFLGVWFNIKSSRDFVKKQLKRECCSFAATIRPAKLSPKQVVYLHNAVLIPKLEYRMQVTHLSESDCHLITRSIRSVKDYIACTIALLTSTPFRLLHTQLSKLPNLSLLDGCVPLFECMTPKAFKAYFPILRKRQLFYLSQLVTPQGTHLISWKAYYDNLVGHRDSGHIPYWYKDIQQVTTISDSNNRLLNHFNITPTIVSSSYDLAPCLSSPPTTKNWIVTLDDYGSPFFGKQLLVQASRGTCSIVHWISPDCESSPDDLIRLSPCPGCAAHTPLPPSKKRNADLTLCTPTVSLQHSLILPTTNERIRRTTSEVTSPFTWADIKDGVRLYYSRLDFDSDSPSADTAVASVTPVTIESSAAAVFANSLLVVSSDSRYIFFTDGSLINLGTPDVSIGWSWMQIVPDASFPNSIATYAHGLIRDNPSSSRAEAAAIYAVLTISPRDSEVTIYTDSQTAIDGLRSCSSFVYSNSRLYFKTTNFELWAIIERTILSKNLTVLPVKVKAHSGNYLNDFADSLANTAHTASSSILISGMDLASAHDFVLTYDNDVVYLTRFHFISLLSSNVDYIVDWDLTWFTLNFKPSYDASFTPEHASRHLTFKFKLFLDDLPTLEKLKRTRPDLYMDELTCRSCIDRMEDLMHLFMCKKRRLPMQQILQSYQNHLISKIVEARKLADIDLTPFIAKLAFLSCWSFSSTNWSSYALVRGCLPKLFIDLFDNLSIPRISAIKVIAAIHNNFVQKFRCRIWNPRSYEKSRWENAMNITYKLKTTPKSSNLPLSTYIPYLSLPPLTLHDSRDSGTDWLKNSMKYGLPWFNHFSGFMGRLTVLLNNSFCRMECQFL
ncbi:RNA-directed DNA polymerase from mobile element jockey-like [Rhizophagus irregularis DAOM 181602=DAOM 197198]|nr:RNA-directed DNA polymerase from mobile element jockey-like [Rhizophagus irregularis DAOM 181602=DAOM 197198]